MKTVQLSEKAQRFLIPPKKKYYIKELKAEIEAVDDEEFERKKQKLLKRNEMYNNGGLGKPRKIQDFGNYFTDYGKANK